MGGVTSPGSPDSTPRTRQERQAETRARLLEVTEEILAEGGYHQASLEKIAERAGFTKGAVYSNFANKEELTLAVLDDHFADWLNELQRRLEAAEPTVAARVDVVARWWGDIVLHERWAVVIMELALSTRDRPSLQEALAEREKMIISFCTLLVQNEIDRFELDLPLSARDYAEALVALGLGLAFTRTLLPEIASEVLSRTARVLFLGTDAGEGDPASST